MSSLDTIREIFELRSNVERLVSDVDRLTDMAIDHANRLARLEAKLEGDSDLTVEKAKNAAMHQLVEVHSKVTEKLVLMEQRLRLIEVDRQRITSFGQNVGQGVLHDGS